VAVVKGTNFVSDEMSLNAKILIVDDEGILHLCKSIEAVKAETSRQASEQFVPSDVVSFYIYLTKNSYNLICRSTPIVSIVKVARNSAQFSP
jgi:hypothetical protein